VEHSATMLPPIIDSAWLTENRDDVVLADVRFYLDGRDPRAAYDAGHLPGAVFIDLHRWLAAEPSAAAGRHPLPTPEHVAEGLGRAGIGDDTRVVAYDDAGGVIAARLVWMLRAIGHDAALLDGGIAAWPGALSTEEPEIQPATFTPRPWPADRLANLDEVAAIALTRPHSAADDEPSVEVREASDVVASGDAPARSDDDGPSVEAREALDASPGSARMPQQPVLIDARQRERFHGEPDGVDPRSGHIPGAQSVPTREHLNADGTLRPVEELRAAFAAAGIEEGTDVISYCGSGVTACHNLLVLEHAGLGRHRLYPGSWSQWSATDLPVAANDE
jgi:thiosulfate/3-mercaptopyruvate sulfurtransferase